MQRLAIQMFVQDSPKKVRKSRNPNQFILQSSDEWERFNELCNYESEKFIMQNKNSFLF